MKHSLSLALLVVLPFCLASIIPVGPFLQGNKKRTPYKVVRTYSNQGKCQELITNWQDWDGGLQFSIVIKNTGSSVINDWKVELKMSKDVDSLRTYDGMTKEISKSKFQVNSASYNGEIQPGQERTFTVHVTYPATETMPNLKYVAINDGDKVFCKDGDDDADDHDATDEASDDGDKDEEEKQDEDNEEENQEATTPAATTTTSSPSTSGDAKGRGVHVPWPKRVMGLYILLADDDEEGFENNADGWTPELYPWQQTSSNVLFFTFIHPETMDIPPSFKKLAATRGTNAPGAVPADTVIIFAIGGYAYSLKPNPWWWLESREAAVGMAEKVAEWPKLYNCDGIDLDLEEGAGSNKIAGPNMVHFIRRLRELQPNMIISQPTYGFPQIQAESDVINASWDEKGNNLGVADSIGLMVYEGTQSLNYVKNFVSGAEQWSGFPIKCNAPSNTILLGAKGSASSSTLRTLAEAAVSNDYRGIMVWYASVKNGFHYAVSWDASIVEDSIAGYEQAMNIFRQDMGKGK